jgi:hypothetical protein
VVPAIHHIHPAHRFHRFCLRHLSLCLRRGRSCHVLATLRRRHHPHRFLDGPPPAYHRVTPLRVCHDGPWRPSPLPRHLRRTLRRRPLPIPAIVHPRSPAACRHGRVSLHDDPSGHSCQAVSLEWRCSREPIGVSESHRRPTVLHTDLARLGVRCLAVVPLHA